MSNVKEEFLGSLPWRELCIHLCRDIRVDGGFTYTIRESLHWGYSTRYSLNKPVSGYSVSTLKEVEKVWPYPCVALLPLIEEYLRDIALGWCLTCDPSGNQSYFGAWVDGENLYFDIVKVVATPAEALALAKANSQLAYYDIEKGESVYV